MKKKKMNPTRDNKSYRSVWCIHSFARSLKTNECMVDKWKCCKRGDLNFLKKKKKKNLVSTFHKQHTELVGFKNNEAKKKNN